MNNEDQKDINTLLNGNKQTGEIGAYEKISNISIEIKKTLIDLPENSKNEYTDQEILQKCSDWLNNNLNRESHSLQDLKIFLQVLDELQENINNLIHQVVFDVLDYSEIKNNILDSNIPKWLSLTSDESVTDVDKLYNGDNKTGKIGAYELSTNVLGILANAIDDISQEDTKGFTIEQIRDNSVNWVMDRLGENSKDIEKLTKYMNILNDIEKYPKVFLIQLINKRIPNNIDNINF